MARPMFVVPVGVKVERCASGYCTALIYGDELNLYRTHRVVIWALITPDSGWWSPGGSVCLQYYVYCNHKYNRINEVPVRSQSGVC